MKNDCIFCKIASNEQKAYKIFENDNIVAFLDIFPSSKGHTLVIPKKHYETYLEMSPDDSALYFKYVNIISKKIKDKIKCDGMIIVMNIGKSSGQEIMHQHTHLIPTWNENKIIYHKKTKNIENESYFVEILNILKITDD